MSVKKYSKKIFLIGLLIPLFFPVITEAAIIAGSEKTSTDGNIGIIEFKSNCTNYTKTGAKGESGVQIPQKIYYNLNGSGTKNPIWFQHGDGMSAPRNHCISRFNVKNGLQKNGAENYVVFCPEMHPSKGSSSGPNQAVWSIKYKEFFSCLYKDFVTAAEKHINISSNVIIASFSQGGPATGKIIADPGVNIKINAILHFDSCYGSYCLNEASLPFSKRGSMFVYVSDAQGTYNTGANRKATVGKKIDEKENVSLNIVTGKAHSYVPQLCGWDFLNPNQCNGKGQNAGGAVAPISNVTSEIKLILEKPVPQITIPGLKFSEVTEVSDGDRKFIYIPFIGEYLSALYRWGVVAASIFAVVMLINNGLKWTISAGSQEKIKHAKERIIQSLVGLLIAVGSYTLLYLINPQLVEFKNLKVLTVEGRSLNEFEQLLSVYGTDGNSSSISTGPFQPGKWRSMVSSQQVCGNKDGMSLATYENRVKRLIPIVNQWKIYTFDQGGAIYSRGGKFDCSDKFWKEVDYQFKKLKIIYKYYPGFFDATDRQDPCFNILMDIVNGNEESPLTLVQNSGIEVLHAQKWMSKIIKKLLTDRAGPMGLVCGDCGTYIFHLYTQCFDNKTKELTERIKARGCPENFGKYVFSFNPKSISAKNISSKVDEILQKLNFGDIITYRHSSGGHYILYTGKGGLDFEILDMGTFNTSRTVNAKAGARLVTKNIGLPKLPWSGVGAYPSAKDFLTRILAKQKYITMCGYRPLDDSYFTNKKK